MFKAEVALKHVALQTVYLIKLQPFVILIAFCESCHNFTFILINCAVLVRSVKYFLIYETVVGH